MPSDKEDAYGNAVASLSKDAFSIPLQGFALTKLTMANIVSKINMIVHKIPTLPGSDGGGAASYLPPDSEGGPSI